jgi:hypothetical protein
VREFAERYRITASLELLGYSSANVALSVLMWVRPRSWVAITLACLVSAFFWKHYISPLSIFFRRPAGEGSRQRTGWWRFNGRWPQLVKQPLMACFAFAWLFIFIRLSKQPSPNSV